MQQLSGPEIKMTNKNWNFISWEWLTRFFPVPDMRQWSKRKPRLAPNLYVCRPKLIFACVLRWHVKTHFFFPCKWKIKGIVRCVWSLPLSYTQCSCCAEPVVFHHQSFSLPWTCSPSLPSRVLTQVQVIVTTSQTFTSIIQYQNFNETSLQVLMWCSSNRVQVTSCQKGF